MKKHQLIAWVCVLSLIAGMINVLGLVKFQYVVSHHTGSLSRISQALVALEWGALLPFFALVLCYVVGAGASGALFASRHQMATKRSGLVLLGVGVVFLPLSVLAESAGLAIYWFAAVMGMQNGLFTVYHDTLVRTTHFSGYLSDVGVAIGRLIRGRKDSVWKIKLYSCQICAFIAGGALSAVILARWPFVIYGVIAALYVLAGGYGVINTQKTR